MGVHTFDLLISFSSWLARLVHPQCEAASVLERLDGDGHANQQHLAGAMELPHSGVRTALNGDAARQHLPMHNLSSDLLQCVPDHLAVIELTGVLWSDWGKPERIAETLRRIDRRPAFPLTCLEHPFVPLPVTAPETGPSLGASSL